MLYFLISCVSFILLSKSFTHKLYKLWKEGSLNLLSNGLFKKSTTSTRVSLFFLQLPFSTTLLPLKKLNLCSKTETNVEEKYRVSLLDLPELALECIFERLSPSGLCNMAGVCTSLRSRCRSDYLWERHLKHKWGRVIGDAANREWLRHVSSRNYRLNLSNGGKQIGLFWSLFNVFPFWCTKNEEFFKERQITSSSIGSIMAWYLSLESGKFWFPAQVYNRENGHVGFMLSSYDAQLSYDSRTDTFRARYSPHGRRTLEENIHWDRVRAPPVDTPPNMIHNSDCLPDLKPGDHIEIQWRKSKEFPYGWWYCVVGHLESCDKIDNNCLCHHSDKVVLKFNQYAPGSRWRRTVINRKDHQEEGNEADGFYGGIRKLYHEEEIARWKSLWPREALE